MDSMAHAAIHLGNGLPLSKCNQTLGEFAYNTHWLNCLLGLVITGLALLARLD